MLRVVLLLSWFFTSQSFAEVSTLSTGASSAMANIQQPPDILSRMADLENPLIRKELPAAGKCVFQQWPSNMGSDLGHLLYLPTDWKPGVQYPVLVEYLGNSAKVSDGRGIGYGLSGGKGFIWLVLPFVSKDLKSDEAWWWGDVEATVEYAKKSIPAICEQWGGNTKQIILLGYSRGAIACNYIGLHDDEISKFWKAMVIVSHYDDAHIPWGMSTAEQAEAPKRLLRLGQIPQLICGEYCSIPQLGSDAVLKQNIHEQKISSFEEAKAKLGLKPILEVEGTKDFIAKNAPHGVFCFMDLPWVNHSHQVLLRDSEQRQLIRSWMNKAILND